ncbi:unnamed protein product [Parnassius mnemosyne]|uniref:Uncharacterized protein n=1 Tax=Parnassius mnemosyne TaxID=213953 RepID=A0AAV1LMG3_9NEOP
MVNYCCVYGCGRNSRLNKHLNYYSLPKERHRQIEWLKAACREDLLKKNEEKVAVSYRFCSRHFPPTSIKNRHLCPDAVPTLCLPGNWSEEEMESEPVVHSDIVCNNCNSPIMGFRYKCVNCDDYDLCQKCEMQEAHPDHCMLRMPKPFKFKLADNLIKEWRKMFKATHVTPLSAENSGGEEQEDCSMSSDDEPITKYTKNYDSGVDLSEDVKLMIRKEVARALKVQSADVGKYETVKKGEALTKKGIDDDIVRPNKRNRIGEQLDTAKIELSKISTVGTENLMQDLVFADVNEIKDDQIVEAKYELPASTFIPGRSGALLSNKLII